MLDLQRIPMSRVRRAYELTTHQADDLIQALCPHAVFPLGLWEQAYEHFWKNYARTAAMRQRADCPVLPDVVLEPGKRFFTDLCGFDVMAFFRKLSLLIDSKIVKMGLEYILSETFGTFDDVYPEDRDFLFSTLQKLEQRGPDYDVYDVENIDDETLFLPASSYHFISHIFFDTILVDRVAVVLHLHDFPLLHEVKGLSHAFVNSVFNPVQQEEPIQIELIAEPIELVADVQSQEPQSQETVFVRRSVWAGKTKEAICDAMRSEGFDKEYILHVLLHKRGLNLTKREIGRLFDEPHKSDSAYDKLGKELVEKAEHVNVLDASEV